MTVYGYSVGTPGAPSTEQTVTDQGEKILAIIDQLMWVRRRLASLPDNAVEPDDIETEDTLRNEEREA